MSPITLIFAAIELGREIVKAVSRPSAPVKPIPFGRPHRWGFGLSDPPVCAYCGTPWSVELDAKLCPGPIVTAK